MTDGQQETGENIPTILRGKVNSLTLYEITDYELDVLERGPPNSLYLNILIFLLSIATAFLIALLTTNITSDRIFNIFVIIIVISYIIGLILLVIWYKSRESSNMLIKKIRDRIPSNSIKSEESEE